MSILTAYYYILRVFSLSCLRLLKNQAVFPANGNHGVILMFRELLLIPDGRIAVLYHKSVTLLGYGDVKICDQAVSGFMPKGRSMCAEDEMFNGEMKSELKPFISEIMYREMKAELHEHRYYLEQKVERRTEHLLKRIASLEACNATLCDKLAAAQQELATLRQAAIADQTMPLHIMDGQWNAHLSAA